jgi:L-iditol 2-dehydrogenase
VLYGPGDLRVEDRDVPQPGPGEVLVEVRAIGICGSDVHYYEHGRIGPYVVTHPMVIGHESAGRVTHVGPGVAQDGVGEIVALEPGVPCGRCLQCRAGRYNLCPDIKFFATPPVDGSIAQFVTIASDFVHRVPSGVSYAQAAMAEPVSVGVWAARKAAIAPGDRVLVTGAGPVGLLAAQVARAFGAAEVVVTDVNAYRLDVAAGLGLRGVPADQDIEETFDVLLECSGSARALHPALRRMAPAGRVVLVGMGEDQVALEIPLIQNRELWLTGTFRYANTYPLALSLIATQQVRVDPLMTHVYPLERAEDALRAGRVEPTALKAVVQPWGE